MIRRVRFFCNFVLKYPRIVIKITNPKNKEKRYTMAQTILEIPEWTGSPLTIASFLAYATSVDSNAAEVETDNVRFDMLRNQLHQLVLRLQDFINQQRAYAQTPEITKQDQKRDSLWKALWYA